MLRSLPKQDSSRLLPAVVRLVSLPVLVSGVIGRSLCLLGGVWRAVLHGNVDVDAAAVLLPSVGALVGLRRRATRDQLSWRVVRRRDWRSWLA